MKIFKLLIVFTILFPQIGNAQRKPKVYFDYKVYYTPNQKAYIETLLQFSSGSLKYVANQNGNLESSIEVTQIFKKNDTIVVADKYIVKSPEMLDSTVEDYFDIKRFQLKPDIYDFEIIITDLNRNESISGEQAIEIKAFQDNEIDFSSIGFIQSASKTIDESSFVKNGYFILPYLTNYFPPVNNKIATYFELYNTLDLLGANEKFMLTFEIEDYLTGNKINDIFKYQKLTTAKIVPIISFLPIDELASGEYNFVVSVINKDNEVVKQERLYFQRRSNLEKPNSISIENLDLDNSFTLNIDFDSIPFFVNCLLPISQRYERESILSLLKTKDTLTMQKYFHAYWAQTNQNAPYEAWVNYKEKVFYVEKLYSTQIKHGFETDRGRIYLKYGAPDYVTNRPNEPSAYPYQIWQYYRIGKRSNIRFVFYNPDLVTNDYPLLHSEMQGELQNYRWQHDLHKRNSPNINIDDPNDGNIQHYGGNANIYFND